MIGKRADHGHVDLFPPFNHGLKDNLNLKYNWQTGIPNVSIWEERELFFLMIGKWVEHGRADFFGPFYCGQIKGR